jgi:hypothetical protein
MWYGKDKAQEREEPLIVILSVASWIFSILSSSGVL